MGDDEFEDIRSNVCQTRKSTEIGSQPDENNDDMCCLTMHGSLSFGHG